VGQERARIHCERLNTHEKLQIVYVEKFKVNLGTSEETYRGKQSKNCSNEIFVLYFVSQSSNVGV
jgi:hypothetical protein